MKAAIDRVSPMRLELVTAKTVAQCADLAERAKAVAVWAKHIGLSLEELNRVARFRLDCMRKAGALIRESGVGKGKKSVRLTDFGVDENQSRRWQKAASLAEQVFDAYCAQCEAGGVEITHAGLWKFVAEKAESKKKASVRESTESPSVTSGSLDKFVKAATREESAERFGCIYADPPWRYGNQATRASTDNHYGTMSVDEICALPVAKLAADDAHLHLWTTNAFLFEAKRVMEAWGFEYKSCFVWVKPQMGIGNYWRVSHEFMLLGVRGDCPFRARNQMSWGAPRRVHLAGPLAATDALPDSGRLGDHLVPGVARGAGRGGGGLLERAAARAEGHAARAATAFAVR